MNIAVRYFTKTGNTKKLADAIAQELNVDARELSVSLNEKADIAAVKAFAGKVAGDNI